MTTKLYTLNVITDVLGGRWRGLEEVPYYSGISLSIIEPALKKEQQVPEIEAVPAGNQLPSSPQQSVTTPMTTGVQSSTQLVETPQAGVEELKLAGFPISTFLLAGLGLGAILMFKKEEKYVS
jgi:hypothetical protein